MRAVHFGAGNIGRGFIGLLLYQAGYDTVFVDVNDTVIRALNDRNQYNVELAAENSETITVKNVTGINSAVNPDDVIEAIAYADIVTTAVGPTILEAVSGIIAKGLHKRRQVNSKPLNIIACENIVGGSSILKEHVLQKLPEKDVPAYEELVGFPDAAVDRIVPNQTNEDILQVMVEPYYEWVVEQTAIKGEKPAIDSIHYVDNLEPFIERKLFTVNTGHAVSAFIGHHTGYKTIYEVMKDSNAQSTIKGALEESGEALIQLYGFDRETHQAYIDRILARFTNPYISDDVTRVARGPIRKLGPKDRLIRPATLYLDYTGKVPANLTKAIAAALVFDNAEDDEAVKLQETVKEQGYKGALQTVSGLEADHPLVAAVLKELDMMT